MVVGVKGRRSRIINQFAGGIVHWRDYGQAGRHRFRDGDERARFVRQRNQEIDDILDLLVGQCETANLLIRHHIDTKGRATTISIEAHHFCQGCEGAIVHIGRCQGDIT